MTIDDILETELQSFVCSGSKVLILGVFPSEKSRQNNFYYMSPSNCFWKMMSEIFQDEDALSQDIEVKKEFLERYNIALWNIASKVKVIDKSTHSKFQLLRINDINSVLENNENIKSIFFTFKESSYTYEEYYKPLKQKNNLVIKRKVRYLPSTSGGSHEKYENRVKAWKDEFINIGLIEK